jgi:hypothetical protein
VAVSRAGDGSAPIVGSMYSSPTGLLVIRVWLEQGSQQPLRAQIRLTTDVSTGLERAMTLTEVDAACEAVRSWLEQMLAGTPRH